MEYVNFYERIHNIKDTMMIAKKVCQQYSLGELINQTHIEISYEDFNMIISTSIGENTLLRY